eukprot:TRINITY_DN379_c0_g1_i1.p1 TRINITY_DN379_c0_g1~~TRINITY_DN379_c0_g1_i1.p1  ORF type:complete len:198 (+),score=35.28 TRINITY_DN379_c0_g1_i1:108-701(+)
MAFTFRSKIKKEKGHNPTQTEESVAQHLFDLQVNSEDKELRGELAKLQFAAAKEVDVGKGKTAVVVFVPYRQYRDYRRIQNSLVSNLEKKLAKHVVFVAQRRILSKPGRNNRKKLQKRPRSRTLQVVHDAILEDLVYPGEVIDKRIRQRVDGSKIMRITLDSKEEQALEHKLETFSAIYRKLTSKSVTFNFPTTASH